MRRQREAAGQKCCEQPCTAGVGLSRPHAQPPLRAPVGVRYRTFWKSNFLLFRRGSVKSVFPFSALFSQKPLTL